MFCGGDLRLEFAVSHMKCPTFPVYSRRVLGVFSAFFSPGQHGVLRAAKQLLQISLWEITIRLTAGSAWRDKCDSCDNDHTGHSDRLSDSGMPPLPMAVI